MQNPKRSTAVITAAAIALVTAPAAVAGTATYNSTAPLHVFDGNTATSTIAIPPGRTLVQSVEVTNFTIGWGASAQELSTQLIGPDGTSLHLFTEGCASYEAQDVWIFSDSGTQTAPNSKFDSKCDLPGGTFKPADPALKKLSIFSGKPSGTWTLRATDNSLQFTNQGDILSWALRVLHAAPTLTATAPKSGKLKKTLALTARSNADGRVSTGDDAQSDTTRLTANDPTRVPYKLTKKVRKKIEKKGKARVRISLDFTDATGGTATESVTVKLKDKTK